MMEMVDFEGFQARISGGWAPKMDTSIYAHLLFDCACGNRHPMGQAVPLRELVGMRLVLNCPALKASATCVKIKGFFRLRLLSEFGCA